MEITSKISRPVYFLNIYSVGECIALPLLVYLYILKRTTNGRLYRCNIYFT